MRVARVADIPIELHWSFLLLVALHAASALATGGLLGLASTLQLGVALFGSVVLHELGHALAGRAIGVRTQHITLYPFGGVAAMESLPMSPTKELVIALAGPAVNVVLFAFAIVGWLSTSGDGWLMFAAINAGMALFNLIPAFPMDGGRVLRAILASPMGWLPATRLSIRVGAGFAWLFVLLGVVSWRPGLLLVGLFLLLAGAAERAHADAIEARTARWIRFPSAPRAVRAAFTRP